MKPTENIANSASAQKAGLFATLCAFLNVKESGAPKPDREGRACSPAPILASLATIGATLLASAALSATAGAYATVEGPPIYSGAPGLPDGRVYEQVSPADKNGNEAGGTTDPFITGASQRYGYAAPDGNSVLFEGTGPMGESPSPDSLLFVAQRSTVGWQTRALEPAADYEGKSVETLDADAGYVDPATDLSHAMVEASSYSLGPEPNVRCQTGGRVGFNQLWLTGPDPFVAATWLEQAEIGDPIENCSSYLGSGAPVGGTPDFSTVYFTYPGTLLPEDASRAPHARPTEDAEGGVGEWEAWGFYEDREGELRAAGILPADSPYPGKLDPFGAVPAASGHSRALAGNQVSENGSRAFFVSPDPASCEQPGIELSDGTVHGKNNCTLDPPELYVRENGQRTVLVSQSQLPGKVGEPAASGPLRMPNSTYESGPQSDGSYLFASPDGSQAFFQSADDLTEEARKGSPGAEPKTYDFDVETGVLTYLPGVVGEIVATDEDGSALAFVKPEAGGAPAELNLWSSAGPAGGRVAPVAQLPGPPSSDGGGFKGGFYVSEARLSADGTVLVFESTTNLSSSFNSGGYEQIYRFDGPANALGCVSCPPHGVMPSGDASISSLQPDETYEHKTADVHGIVDSRGISSDGNRIFFDSPDPLVPQDTNTNAPEVEVEEAEFAKQGRDVYEWENGVVYLISGGKSPRNSVLLDSSESGNDVFFATTEGLVPGDTDGGYDVYDARVPHPGDNPPAAAVPCEGSVCQGPPNVPSPLTPPASATFSGLGNPTPEVAATPTTQKKAATKKAKCAKGKKLRRGKCVKQRRSKITKTKKSAKGSK